MTTINEPTWPIDGLKIDRGFVQDIAASACDAALCKAMIGLAHELDMRVVAEGVETEAQFDILSAQGCDRVQGYLLGKPQPALALPEALVRAPTQTTRSLRSTSSRRTSRSH